MMKKRVVLLCSCFLMLFSWTVQAGFELSFKGCVKTEKTVIIENKISLFSALKTAELAPCAFLFGAAWLSPSLIEEQKVLKKDLLSELHFFIRSERRPAVKLYFQKIEAMLLTQFATGRISGIDFDLFQVEMMPLKNRIITFDSKFFFPKQPKNLNLIGFAEPSVVYDSNLSIGELISKIRSCSVCQPGWVWIVQPNTQIEKIKVGFWTNEEYYAAPGAWLIAPLPEVDIKEISPQFYQKLTLWLALQVSS